MRQMHKKQVSPTSQREKGGIVVQNGIVQGTIYRALLSLMNFIWTAMPGFLESLSSIISKSVRCPQLKRCHIDDIFFDRQSLRDLQQGAGLFKIWIPNPGRLIFA